MNALKLFSAFLLLMLTYSCIDQNNAAKSFDRGTFNYDLNFLKSKDSNLIVLAEGESKIIVSPKYQAKVFTSTTEGDTGTSIGWINYKAFDTTDAHMNAYGGENRLWLGPEGGPFSVFFPMNSKMEFANWKTPAAFDREPWNLLKITDSMVVMDKSAHLINYAGTGLSVSVTRLISILDRATIESLLKIKIDSSVKSVGYKTRNILTNTGVNEWNDTTGMPCIWILDMLNPSDNTTIFIPFFNNSKSKPATTTYFGEIPADRIAVKDSILYFKADGKQRGKLGIHPGRAKNIAGSFDAKNNILTINIFDIDNNAKYLNQEWGTDKPPFSGDAVNAYNDGPLATGGQLGPFYEIESVSPAAFLKPGNSLTHNHAVFHFTGDKKSLDKITKNLLGISIAKIESALK